MKIDKNLNLTFSAGEIPAFHTPISFPLFQQHSLILADFFAKTMESYFSHPAIAHSLFVSLYTVEGKLAEKADALIKDLTRSTFFYIAGKPAPVGFETAVNDKLIDEEDASEVLSSLIFFTETLRINSATMKNAERNLSKLAGASFISLPVMDWHNSLLTAKETENTPTTG
jgi:hypothetical protein